MSVDSCAYLDIETTGLKPGYAEITVVGVYIENKSGTRIVQLVGDEIQTEKLLELFKDIRYLFTYNGSRFDLPFIYSKFGIDLERYCSHIDLMYICWQNNLYGGFKEVEKKLGIRRELTHIDGKEAVILWYKYINNRDEAALKILLKYNKEDLINLRILRYRLTF